jgi:hypothetical protein
MGRIGASGESVVDDPYQTSDRELAGSGEAIELKFVHGAGGAGFRPCTSHSKCSVQHKLMEALRW